MSNNILNKYLESVEQVEINKEVLKEFIIEHYLEVRDFLKYSRELKPKIDYEFYCEDIFFCIESGVDPKLLNVSLEEGIFKVVLDFETFLDSFDTLFPILYLDSWKDKPVEEKVRDMLSFTKDRRIKRIEDKLLGNENTIHNIGQHNIRLKEELEELLKEKK